MTDNFSRLIIALLAVWVLALMPLLLLEPHVARPLAAVVAAYFAAGSRPALDILGDDIGQQPAFDLRDLILQHEFALLQPLHLQLVEGLRLDQPCDDVVEVAVLGLEVGQLVLQRLDLVIFHRSVMESVGMADTIPELAASGVSKSPLPPCQD